MKFIILALLVIGLVHCEECNMVETVYNGNFQQPQIFKPWSKVASIPGGKGGSWKSDPPSNGFFLWKQGEPSAPVNDSQGRQTGQHLQINGDSTWAQISYQFIAPCLLGSEEAVLSFEYWYRSGYVVDHFEFEFQQGGVSNMSDGSNPMGEWKKELKTVKVEACQPATIIFQSVTSAQGGGVNIDNVSLKLIECKHVQMIQDGDFNKPQIYQACQQVQSLPGNWQSSPGTSGFTLWQQGAMGIPPKNNQGLPTGQTLEVNGQSSMGQVSYSFFVPHLIGKANATLSFDYWFNPSVEVYYFGVKVVQGGQSVVQKTLYDEYGWENVMLNFELSPGKAATLYFICDVNSIGGVHIDAVSLDISEVRVGFQTVNLLDDPESLSQEILF